MKKSSIEDLEIYQSSIEISDKIWDLVIPWDNFAKNTIGSQLVRASDSVGANISEGYGRGSKLDNARFVKIARGSLFETQYWLNQANKRKLLSNDDLTEIISKIETLLPRISAYINYLSKSFQKR
ncbi:MAG: four helix bundle protein [Ignavibacteriaceae bacterium]|nr:four helix bundle protein [Ignavibacteriaceae bacterium]